MNTRTLIAFLLVASVFVSCSKTETFIPYSPPFTIGGVHDVTMDTSYNAFLELSVKVATGDTNRAVFVWVSGVLPRGINVIVNPDVGTTDFNASIIFAYDPLDTVAPGTYPLKVMGASGSDTATYDFNLTLSPFNGFMLSQKLFLRTAAMSHTTNNVTIRSQAYGGVMLVGDNPAAWPTADGTYTYRVGDDTGKSLNFTYAPDNHRFESTYNSGYSDSAVVTISGGKMSIRSGDLHAKAPWGNDKIVINASE